MHDIELSRNQKKIFIIGGIVLVVFVGLWMSVYMPMQKEARRLEAELTEIQNQIHYVETVVGDGVTMEEGIRNLQGRLRALNLKFPDKEEKALRILADLAREEDLVVSSTRPQPKEPFLTLDGNLVEIDGKRCHRLQVNMEARCMYKDLETYLKRLREELPAFVTVERINIAQENLGASALNVSLTITLYLLS